MSDADCTEARWSLPTEWLYKLALTHRARAQYALAWRPRFLAVVALSRSIVLACRAAKVSRPTVNLHRRNDPDFDAQVIAAQEHAVELLHDVAFRRALEGDCEPIFWQGIQVGHVRKFDGRLQVEMLRAHMPSKFKTPGSGQPLVSGNNNQVLIITPEQRDELVRQRQEALEAMNPKRLPEVIASNEAMVDSSIDRENEQHDIARQNALADAASNRSGNSSGALQ